MARPSRFSPRSEPHEALEQRTVCREEQCSSLVRGIADAVRTGQARFDLVLGPRGAGKSHLLGLIEGRLRKELEGRAIVVGLPEEFHPSSLVHLLAEILRCLPPDPEAGPVERRLAVLAASPEDARQRAVGMIKAHLQKQPLVIIVENLDVILAAIGRDGQHQLRSILQTERCWSIVASSRSWAASFAKESEPFFGMFIPRTLEPLSAEDCRTMLVHLAKAYGREELVQALDTPKGLARVQTLRHVLGGYPRAMAFIFPHLHHDRPDAVEQALRDLAEELTPYFQEQMSRLPVGQRPVAELLAEHWAPLSVGEIASATFNSQPTVSTYLRRMRDDAIVRSTKLGREHFYEIADPLFRIARAMKRVDLRAKTFLRVLQSWYELRGFDLWQLPMGKRIEIGTPLDLDGDFHTKLFAPWIVEIQEGRYREALRGLAALDTNHLFLTVYRIVALSRLGEDGEAFEAIQARNTRMRAIVCGVAAVNFHTGRSSKGHGSLAERFCTAILTIANIVARGEAGSVHSEMIVVEEALRASSPVVREVATHVSLEFVLPSLLVRSREFELARSLLALLEPVATEALSFNLAQVILDGWAAGQLPKVFHGGIERSVPLSTNLGSLATIGLFLAAYDDSLDQAATNVVKAGIADFLRRYKDSAADGLRAADRKWMTVFFILLTRHLPKLYDAALLVADFRELSSDPSEPLRAIATAIHESILQWIAAGRDLSPVLSALPFQERMAAELSMNASLITSHDPDVAYVRLAAPERAAVRHFAKALGLEQRYARLCALSPDEDS